MFVFKIGLRMITMPKTKSTLTTGKNAAISTKEAQVELAMLQKRQAYLQKVLGTAKPMQTSNPFIVNIHTCGRTRRKAEREYRDGIDNEQEENEPRLKKAEQKRILQGVESDDDGEYGDSDEENHEV